MAKKKMNRLELVATILVLVGALNWGLFAFGFNIVELIFGGFANWVYYAVGLSAIFSGYKLFK